MPGGKVDIILEPDARQFGAKAAGQLRAGTGILGTAAKGVGLAVAAGAGLAAVGLKQVISLGVDYQAKMNELQAVSGASGAKMKEVGERAKELGNDLTLPGTSAADATNAMLELAKGGLSVNEAMKAAKGTLQLAAAAQVDGATAAEIQSNSLNAFRLKAADAGHVADVLANTANAAAGGITDIGMSMKYVAPVANALGVSIDDTATAVGLLANNGIKADQAGTSLRGILASLAHPSAAAGEGMETLGLKAFDASGKFVGLRALTDQLSKAKHRLTDEEFQSAAAVAFGNEGLTAANVLAAEGAKNFDDLGKQVSRQGGAAQVAAAKMKGLGGAFQGFQSTLETLGLEIYEHIAPGLEAATRQATQLLSDVGPGIAKGLGEGLDALTEKGKDASKGLEDFQHIADGIKDVASGGFKVAKAAVGEFVDVVGNAVDLVRPLARGIADLVSTADDGGSAFDAIAGAVHLAGDAIGVAQHVLQPFADLLGGVLSLAGELPDPIKNIALAMAAMRFGPGLLSNLRGRFDDMSHAADGGEKNVGRFTRGVGAAVRGADNLAGGVRGAVGQLRNFGEHARLQATLADRAGVSLSRWGSYVAAFNTTTEGSVGRLNSFRDHLREIQAGAAASGHQIGVVDAAVRALGERSSAVGQMVSSFDNARAGATRFGRIAGTAAAATKGVSLAAGGLVGALGGPWGLAIGGAVTALGLLSDSQTEAAQATEAHRQREADLGSTLDQTTGAVTRATRAMIAKELTSDTDLANAAKSLNISLGDVADAATYGGASLDNFYVQLRRSASGALLANENTGDFVRGLQKSGISLDTVTRAALGNQNAINQLRNRLGPAGVAVDDWLESLRGAIPVERKLQGHVEDTNHRLFDQGNRLRDVAGAGPKAANALRVLGNRASGAGEKVAAYNALLDAVPALRATKIFQPGMPGAQRAADILRNKVINVPNDKTIHTKALTATAIAELRRLGLKVTTLPDGTVNVSANTSPAYDAVAAFRASLARTPAPIRVSAMIPIIPGRAEGGEVERRKPYMVGERGPELIYPDRSGYVATAAQTAKIMAATRMIPTAPDLRTRARATPAVTTRSPVRTAAPSVAALAPPAPDVRAFEAAMLRAVSAALSDWGIEVPIDPARLARIVDKGKQRNGIL